MNDSRSIYQPSLLPGVVLWSSFAILAVLLRGVRWDENYEFAQAMNPAFNYPEGHPLFVYVRNVYNIQFHLSGLAALLTDSPAILNGFRNLAFILATVLPPFLLGAIVGRRAFAGHLCVLFVLAGIHLEFDGSYPQFVWPGMFSNGHIGTGFALATVALFAGGFFRTAALMLGVMPMIHLGQLPPLLLLAAFFGAAGIAKGRWEHLRTALPYLFAGLGFCAAYFLFQRMFAVAPAETGPYAGTVPASEVWSGLIRHHDMHRQIPVGNSHLVPLLMVPLAVGGWRFLDRAAWNWLCIYAAGVVVIVYLTIAIQMALAEETPYVVIGWLPYRLANQLPIILIAMAVAILLEGGKKFAYPAWVVVGLLLFLTVRPMLSGVMADSTYVRFFSTTESVLFALVGAAVSRLIAEKMEERSFAITLALACVLAWLILAWFHQFGAACAAFGAVLGWIFTRHFPRGLDDRRALSYSAAAIGSVFIATTLFTEFRNRSHLPVGHFERAVSEYLNTEHDSRAMLVGPPYQLMLQAQTGHPVFSDMATHYHGSYMPSLAPSVHRMYEEVYGFDLTRSGSAQSGWRMAWAARPSEEWAAVSQEFAFDYVVAPNDLDVRLTRVIEGETNSLFRIPRSHSDGSAP